ncbi:MAG: 16S rRNA pseudouridine(516) synthase [Lachnospiraceae bacterium]|nr:16S rRNA pseudouridine(516) synthase [Lachnospiraceae bacterium]MBO6208944.1 16S rRNA pseudouridine(516) synthase [Lachnospiraceae bacterium]
MRLDKYLADMHVGTRSEVKEQIRKGRVQVNGSVVKDPGLGVSAEDCVEADGVQIGYQEHFYYMLNKPAGILTATEDRKQPTVLDLFPENLRKNLAPVGRLDKDTVGLLLITDDGALAHRLLAPKSHVDKVYLAGTDLPVTDEDVKRFAGGMTLADGTQLMPAGLEILSPDRSRVTIHEGKFHQIKRMFEACGKKVVYLKRLSMGTLTLDPTLPEGEWRELTKEEVRMLRS